MTEADTFPIFVHILTIPLTLGVGFFLGWVIRGAAAKRASRRPDRMIPSA